MIIAGECDNTGAQRWGNDAGRAAQARGRFEQIVCLEDDSGGRASFTARNKLPITAHHGAWKEM